MPARTARSYTVPGVGTTTRGKGGKAKTFTGKGLAPSGTTKVAEPSYSELPTVTVTDSGVSTAGFGSQKAARRARRAHRARARRVRRIVTETRPKTQKRPKAPEYKSPSYESAAAKVIVSSTPLPEAKPETFHGMKTAGAPMRKELQQAASAGTLKVNKAGFATTPKVRKVGGELRRLQAKARGSSAPLPGLGPEESKNAHTVLRRGEKKKATRKEKLAAITTGLVEAPDFKNPAGGHADSEGWRQERTSIYGTGPQGPRNVKASADRFFDEVRTDAGTDTAPTPGLLAQAAQGSAYPERYDEELPQAKAILKAHNKGSLKPAQRKKLAATKAKAAKLGLRVAQPKGALGPPPRKVVKRYKAGRLAMQEVDKAGFKYSWAGGHNASFAPIGGEGEGYDCSGAVSYALHKMKVIDAPLTSGEMGSVLKPGPGALTVFYNSAHTFMYDAVKKEYWGTSSRNAGGGAGYYSKSVGDSQVASGEYSVGHVPGLGRKQAIQMGATGLGSAKAFPGMTLSSSGTTATISGASTTQSKPGFSNKPIKLTRQQKVARTKRKLKSLGVGESSTATSRPSSVLEELERKYQVAA